MTWQWPWPACHNKYLHSIGYLCSAKNWRRNPILEHSTSEAFDTYCPVFVVFLRTWHVYSCCFFTFSPRPNSSLCQLIYNDSSLLSKKKNSTKGLCMPCQHSCDNQTILVLGADGTASLPDPCIGFAYSGLNLVSGSITFVESACTYLFYSMVFSVYHTHHNMSWGTMVCSITCFN